MQVKKIFILFSFFKVASLTSSGQANYLEISKINYTGQASLTIEKNTLFTDKFNIVTDLSEFISPANSETTTISENVSNLEFENTSFVSMNLASDFSDVNVSVSSDSCLFVFIFGSQTKPIFSISENVANVETLQNQSNFEQLYGTTKEFTSKSYSKKQNGASYQNINILCPFYVKVRQKIFFIFN
jgi:hypothetical protein